MWSQSSLRSIKCLKIWRNSRIHQQYIFQVNSQICFTKPFFRCNFESRQLAVKGLPVLYWGSSWSYQFNQKRIFLQWVGWKVPSHQRQNFQSLNEINLFICCKGQLYMLLGTKWNKIVRYCITCRIRDYTHPYKQRAKLCNKKYKGNSNLHIKFKI